MKKDHLFFHKLKAIIGYSIAVVVILVALAVSGLRFLLTTANLYQQEAEDLASSLLEQPVKIGGMDAKLSGLEPTLVFRNVELLSTKSAKPVFSLYRVEIGLSLKDLVWRQKIVPGNITVSGVNLEVTRTEKGKLKITGIDLGGMPADVSAQEQDTTFRTWLFQRNNIALDDCNIVWKDQKHGNLKWAFDNISLLLKNDDGRHQLMLSGNLPPDLGEKIKLAVDINGDMASPDTWVSRFYLETRAVNLTPLQKYIKHSDFLVRDGMVDLKLWGDWEKSGFKRVSGNIDLNDFSYQFKNKKTVKVSVVSGIFDARHDENNFWRVGVDKFIYLAKNKNWPESRFSLAFKMQGNTMEKMFANVSHIRLESLTQLAVDNDLLSSETIRKIESYKLQGDVKKFKLAWYDNKLQAIASDFNNIGSAPVSGMPAFRGLYGHIEFSKNRGHAVIDTRDAMLNFPGLFRDKFALNLLKADVDLLNLKKGLLLNINELRAENTEASTVSHAKLWIPAAKSSPYLDLQTYISKGDLSALPHFLPAGIMSRNLVKWLDQGIVAGTVHDGRVVFNGRLDAFPFRKHDGMFQVDVDADKFELNYQDGWPRIKQAKINAVFTGLGMELNLFSGQANNNLLYDSQARINSFSQPELNLALNARGTFNNTMQFLVNSPILPGAKKTVSSTHMQGDAISKIKIDLPLANNNSGKQLVAYQGETELRQAALLMLDNKVDITGINGKIIYNEEGQSSENLRAKVFGEDTALSVLSDKNNSGLKIISKGKMEPGKILKRFNIQGAEHISGKTAWQGEMVFPPDSSKKSHPQLNIKSNLQGVESTLPDEFYKTGINKENVNLQFSFIDENKIQLALGFGKRSSAVLEIMDSGKSVFLNRGAVSFSENKAILPKKHILYVDGSIDQFAPDKWQQALFSPAQKERSTFLVYPVVLNLDKLKLVLPEENGKQDKQVAVTPKEVPVISGIIQKLYLDDISVGRVDFTTSRNKQGLHLDEVIMSAPHMKVVGQGDWTNAHGKQVTTLDLTLSSDDFGNMLHTLGFAAIIDNGSAQAVAKLSWQDAMTKFSLKKLNGEVQFNLKNGTIKEVDPGAGRMLGLFSLSALPRKLFGDFKDIIKTGFVFDEAKGEINIRQGDAYTEGFEITSPAAKVTINGRTGIAARDYDNTVTVVPDVGGTAAGVIALLGNIPAGIGVWLVNKLSGDQINKGSTRKYEISGSWEKPVIKQINQ